MNRACTVRLCNGQCIYFQLLEWTVYVLSVFGMDSSCTGRLWNGQCMYCQCTVTLWNSMPIYRQPLEWTVCMYCQSLDWTMHVLPAFIMESA